MRSPLWSTGAPSRSTLVAQTLSQLLLVAEPRAVPAQLRHHADVGHLSPRRHHPGPVLAAVARTGRAPAVCGGHRRPGRGTRRGPAELGRRRRTRRLDEPGPRGRRYRRPGGLAAAQLRRRLGAGERHRHRPARRAVLDRGARTPPGRWHGGPAGHPGRRRRDDPVGRADPRQQHAGHPRLPAAHRRRPPVRAQTPPPPIGRRGGLAQPRLPVRPVPGPRLPRRLAGVRARRVGRVAIPAPLRGRPVPCGRARLRHRVLPRRVERGERHLDALRQHPRDRARRGDRGGVAHRLPARGHRAADRGRPGAAPQCAGAEHAPRGRPDRDDRRRPARRRDRRAAPGKPGGARPARPHAARRHPAADLGGRRTSSRSPSGPIPNLPSPSGPSPARPARSPSARRPGSAAPARSSRSPSGP